MAFHLDLLERSGKEIEMRETTIITRPTEIVATWVVILIALLPLLNTIVMLPTLQTAIAICINLVVTILLHQPMEIMLLVYNLRVVLLELEILTV